MNGLEQPLTAAHLIALNRAATIARLLAGTVHEVNNALQVIGGSAELLEGARVQEDALTRGMSRIRSQTSRAAGVIGEVLTLAREDPEKRGVVNLRDVVERSVALRKFSLGRAGIAIELTAPEGGDFAIPGSRVLLQQVVLNLITNAEQAVAGSPGASIRVELGRTGDRAVVRVVDNGPGVAPGERTRIFEPFVTTRLTDQCAGLGLPVARRIAESHGGTLTLEDTASGTSFALEVPLAVG